MTKLRQLIQTRSLSREDLLRLLCYAMRLTAETPEAVVVMGIVRRTAHLLTHADLMTVASKMPDSWEPLKSELSAQAETEMNTGA